jgi:hypothetical protein
MISRREIKEQVIMEDFMYCLNKQCHKKEYCFRFAEQSKPGRVYLMHRPDKKNKCSGFIKRITLC